MATRTKRTDISTELKNKPNVKHAVLIKPLNVIQKSKEKNVGCPQYEHLYSAIINSTSKHNANERPVSLNVNENSSRKSELNENIVNYRHVVNNKYTNVNAVHGKSSNELTTEITVEKETVSNESVVPKAASEFLNDVTIKSTIKSSLTKSKKDRQKKWKSVKRVRFTDDPESIPFWRRFVHFFHLLWNHTRNSVNTLRITKSKFILLQLMSYPALSFLIFEMCVWQLI